MSPYSNAVQGGASVHIGTRTKRRSSIKSQLSCPSSLPHPLCNSVLLNGRGSIEALASDNCTLITQGKFGRVRSLAVDFKLQQAREATRSRKKKLHKKLC